MKQYFEAIPFSKRKPNDGMWRSKVVVMNQKRDNVTVVTPGMVTDWEYFIGNGYTHWLKPVTKAKLCKEFTK